MSFLAHEGPDARSLRALPICVRRKLEEAELRLDEEDFVALPKVVRQRLVDMRVTIPVERRAFRQLVLWLQRTFLEHAVLPTTFESRTFPWQSDDVPPGLELTPDAWAGLGLDARYALFRSTGAERTALLTKLLPPAEADQTG